MLVKESYSCSCLLCKKNYTTKGIHTHYLSAHTDYGIEHRKNTNTARLKAISINVGCQYCKKLIQKGNHKKHEKSCIENLENRRKCKFCNKEIIKNTFCNSSCGASFNNRKRSNYIGPKEVKPKFTKIIESKCINCNKIFFQRPYINRKTCSKLCKEQAKSSSSGFGSLKITKYFNKHENKTICLQSSWELEIAKILDNLNIKWTRPSPLSWIDKNNKQRLY